MKLSAWLERRGIKSDSKDPIGPCWVIRFGISFVPIPTCPSWETVPLLVRVKVLRLVVLGEAGWERSAGEDWVVVPAELSYRRCCPLNGIEMMMMMPGQRNNNNNKYKNNTRTEGYVEMDPWPVAVEVGAIEGWVAGVLGYHRTVDAVGGG